MALLLLIYERIRQGGWAYDHAWIARDLSHPPLETYSQVVKRWGKVLGFNSIPVPYEDSELRERRDLPIVFLGTSNNPYPDLDVIVMLAKKHGYDVYLEFAIHQTLGGKRGKPFDNHCLHIFIFPSHTPASDLPVAIIKNQGRYLYKAHTK